MLGIAFLFGALPQAVMAYLQQTLTSDRFVTTANLAGAIGLIAVIALINILLGLVVQGGLVRATMTEMEGERATFGQCAASGFSRALPLLGIGILLVLGLGLGLLLLVVPGVILYLMWSVAIPVTVVERRGVIASMSRSGDLTSGARGIVFALMLIVWAVAIGASMLSTAIGTMLAGIDGAGQTGVQIAALVVDAVITTVVTVFTSAIPTVLYVELREWKEGPIADTLTDIFA